MSVQVNTYVMRGALFEFSPFKGRYDELQPYMDNAFGGIHHHRGLCVLYDGMNGRFVAIGRVLTKTEDGCHLTEPVRLSSGDDLADELLRVLIEELAGQPAVIETLIIPHYR